MSSPILLLQWLPAGEYRETQTALAQFAPKVNIDHVDVLTKEQAKRAIEKWLLANKGNTQYLFVGAHGIPDDHGKIIGIGASSASDEFATWHEIWQWMGKGEITGGLWLGACDSADAAKGFTPLLAGGACLVVKYIVGFNAEIWPKDIENVLLRLLGNTSPDNIVYLDEELELIRQDVPDTKAVMFYPAHTKAGSSEYVNVDEFEHHVGKSFRQHLEDESM
jgi:hypothetical protein